MAAVTIHSDFGAQENKICHCFYFLPIHLPWCDGTSWHMGLSAMILDFWKLSFKPAFPLSSFTSINRFFSYSLLSAIAATAARVVPSAYLRLLLFLPAILIPICVSSSLAFLPLYSACKLNKQGDNIQPWCTSSRIMNQSIVPCLASWLAYRFHKRQVRWSGIPISWRIFHSHLWSTQSKALA